MEEEKFWNLHAWPERVRSRREVTLSLALPLQRGRGV